MNRSLCDRTRTSAQCHRRRLREFKCKEKDASLISPPPPSATAPYRCDRYCVLMHVLNNICFLCVPVPRVTANLPVSPAHMLIPWFSARSRSNAGHNPLCVFAPGSVIWNDRITGEHDTAQCLRGRTVGTCYSA